MKHIKKSKKTPSSETCRIRDYKNRDKAAEAKARLEQNACPAAIQLARLDSRLGKGVGAYKERTKLNKLIGENDG